MDMRYLIKFLLTLASVASVTSGIQHKYPTYSETRVADECKSCTEEKRRIDEPGIFGGANASSPI